MLYLSLLYYSILFVSYLSCSCCNSSAYRKGCSNFVVKGEGMEKGRGIPFPFLCFWFLLSHHKRSFLLFLTEKVLSFHFFGKETGSSCSGSKGAYGTFPQRRKRICCFKGTPKVHFRIALRSVGQSRIPALLSRLFGADCQSAPDW